MRTNWFGFSAILAAAAGAMMVRAQDAPKPAPIGYDDTPLLPDSEWRVHDIRRPRPPVVTPGTSGSAEAPGLPPSDAAVLFDGKDLSRWQKAGGGPAGWK